MKFNIPLKKTQLLIMFINYEAQVVGRCFIFYMCIPFILYHKYGVRPWPWSSYKTLFLAIAVLHELYFVFLTTFVDVETLTLMRFDLFTFQGTQPLPYFKLLKQKRQGFYIAHVCVFVATRTLHCGSVQYFFLTRDLGLAWSLAELLFKAWMNVQHPKQ